MSTENRAETEPRTAADTASANLCGCTRYKPHWVHGDPWCHCGHPRWDHAEGDDACNSRLTQPAGEHHTGTLNLTGEGNAPASPISDELVVAATKAQHQLTDDEWHGMPDSARAYASTGVRRSLEAAYPAIRQQVAEEIAAALTEAGDARSKHRNHERPAVSRLGSVRHASYLDAAQIAREIGGAA